MVTAEVNRWQMRNEELETRLVEYMEKCHSLKMIVKEQ
jgi:hypothetical protein